MEQKKERPQGLAFYWRLFCATFSLSAFTFGGGYVIVPLMRKKFVDKLHWIEEAEMLDLVAIAQSAPGPIAVNTALLVGYRLAGIPGALLSVLGTATPPLFVITVVSLLYDSFRTNPYVNAAMQGMRIGVAAVLLDVIITMASDIIKTKNVQSIIIMLLAFVAVYCFHVHILIVFAVCAAIGAAQSLYKGRKGAAK